jgi:hypothetical protein
MPSWIIYRHGDRREGGRRVGLAFGDVVDLAGGRVGEEPDGDLPLLAVTERLAGAAFVRHFGALERQRRRWVEKRGGGDGRSDVECVERVGTKRSGGRRAMATRTDGT